MTKTRYHTHRADENHWQIIHQCERVGLLIEDIHNGGLADIIVGRLGRVWIFEIKAPGKRKNLTPMQQYRRLLWGQYIHVVESADEIFKIVGFT